MQMFDIVTKCDVTKPQNWTWLPQCTGLSQFQNNNEKLNAYLEEFEWGGAGCIYNKIRGCKAT